MTLKSRQKGHNHGRDHKATSSEDGLCSNHAGKDFPQFSAVSPVSGNFAGSGKHEAEFHHERRIESK
jgi:hypothetical protein